MSVVDPSRVAHPKPALQDGPAEPDSRRRALRVMTALRRNLGTRRLRRLVCREILFDSTGEIRDAALVSGTRRSGTTWLADVINFDNHYRYMFEPFHPKEV